MKSETSESETCVYIKEEHQKGENKSKIKSLNFISLIDLKVNCLK